MIERDMEDLLANFPGDFFPRKNLVLRGRQESFAGIGRFDLLFEDEFQSTILMELKVRPAKYEDATQVARYRDGLKRQGRKNVFMWLIAPQISPSVREFLEDKGIEYSEIHISEFRRVAERHEFAIKSEVEPTIASEIAPNAGDGSPRMTSYSRSTSQSFRPNVSVATGPTVTVQPTLHWKARGFDLVLQNPADFDQHHFSALVDAFEHSVVSNKNAGVITSLRQWAEMPRATSLPSGTVNSLLRWVTTSSFKTAVPCAEAIWHYLFGKPVPTWYVWNQGRRSYEFDATGWQHWFESLSVDLTPSRIETIPV